MELSRGLPGRVLRLLQESTTTTSSEGGQEERDILVVLESPDLLLHTDGLGYSGVMDLVMGVLEVLGSLLSFIPSSLN